MSISDMPGLGQMLPNLIDFVYLVPAVLLAMTIHEYAHGYVSYRLGDPTPVHDGRLSLNPLHHLDPLGTIMLILFRFGWAKPVMVNPQYYRRPKQGMAMVAAAGPLANFVLAFLSIFIYVTITKLYGGVVPDLWHAALRFFTILASINVGLGVFNLIPIPPLDGSKVFGAFLPNELYARFLNISTVGFIIVLALFYFGILTKPLMYLLMTITNGLVSAADALTFFLNQPGGLL